MRSFDSPFYNFLSVLVFIFPREGLGMTCTCGFKRRIIADYHGRCDALFLDLGNIIDRLFLYRSSAELVKAVGEVESRAKEISEVKRNLEASETDKSNRLKEMEKELRTLKLEKDDTSRELSDAQDKLKQQSKVGDKNNIEFVLD